jgi:hypothetical protein
MLGYFPASYRDELLYSSIARYALHTGQEHNHKSVISDIFSSRTAVAIPDLPSHLKALVRNLSVVWMTDVKALISTQTLAPIYLPFLGEDKAIVVRRAMASKAGGNIHTTTGIAASSIKQPVYFRYCPICTTGQNSQYGEAYWLRAHQLPGLDFCKRHSCLLENSQVNFHSKEKHHFISAASACIARPIRSTHLRKQEMILHDRYLELLEAPLLEGLGANRWTLFYRSLAHDLGLVQKNRVQHEVISRIMRQKWRRTNFERQLVGPVENHWLVNLFRKHRKSFHPLRHLLVLSALLPSSTVTQIFARVRKLPASSPSKVPKLNKIKVVSAEVKHHRQLWLHLLVKHPEVGIKKLRELPSAGALYAWLYRNNYKWLMQNRPKPLLKGKAHYTVDYANWDKCNLVVLKKVYKELYIQPNRPRLTQAHYIKALPRSNSIEKHLNDLPETSQWLSSHTETIEDFQLRRLKSAFELIKTLNQEVKRWRLLRYANIRKELITPKIEIEILKLEQKSG